MTKTAKTLITAATLAAALAGGVAQAASVNANAGDKYGYSYRVGNADAFTDGARTGKFDPFTEGARSGKFDPFTEGARVGKPDPYT
ncbi:MAG: copper resistance protein CopQ, partial [Cupriavidus sp.]|nr:copper resistance protein CopQ [Cupriavidus sp.]